MPEIRYYLITQERTVKVSATNPTDAVVLANRVLSGTMNPEDQVNVQERPRDISMFVREI